MILYPFSNCNLIDDDDELIKQIHK